MKGQYNETLLNVDEECACSTVIFECRLNWPLPQYNLSLFSLSALPLIIYFCLFFALSLINSISFSLILIGWVDADWRIDMSIVTTEKNSF